MEMMAVGAGSEIGLPFTVQEFAQIKQENLVCIQSMQSTLQFGMAAIAILVAAISASWERNILVTTFMLILAVPAVSRLIQSVWSAEVVRLARASYFLWQLEIELNHYFKSEIGSSATAPSGKTSLTMANRLHWEGWVRGENDWGKNILMRRNYKFTLNFLLVMGALGPVLGLVQLARAENVAFGWVVGASAWACVIGAYFVRERLLTWRNIALYATGSRPR